jgi:hypothetical protein
MKRSLTATEKLLNKTFGIKDFSVVLQTIEEKPERFFTVALFVDKATYLQKLRELDQRIQQYADVYSMAQQALRSGSIMASLGSQGKSEVHQPYVEARRAMVHHVGVFFERKK